MTIARLGFDYSTIETNKVHAVRASVAKICHLVVRSMESVVEIGKELSSVKEALPHGRFRDWLEAEFGWKERTARRFMNVASRFQSVNLTDVEMDVSAAYLLSAPSAPKDAVEEAIRRARSGERITHRAAARILQLYTDRPAEQTQQRSFGTVIAELQKALDECRRNWPPEKSSLLARLLRDCAAELEQPYPAECFTPTLPHRSQ